MKRLVYSRVAIINEEDAASFEAAINARLDALADCKPELVIESIKDNTAFIRYTVDEIVPETLADKCELMGVKYYCSDCLYCTFKTNKDGSINQVTKKAYCEHARRQIILTSPACENFYFELISGTGQFSRGGEPEDAKKLLNKENRTKLLTSEEFKIAAGHHANR